MGLWGMARVSSAVRGLMGCLLREAAGYSFGLAAGALSFADVYAGRPRCGQRANFSMAAGETGVKKLTTLPSGSRNRTGRAPQPGRRARDRLAASACSG